MQLFCSPYLEFIRNTALALPAVTEKLCFDTPAFYVSHKLFARLKEDGGTLVLYSTDREQWMKEDPETFFITAHYRNYKYVLIALSNIKPNLLETMLENAWRERASAKLCKELDQRQLNKNE
jgi:hypothetical protein